MKRLFGLLVFTLFSSSIFAHDVEMEEGLYARILTTKGEILIQLEFEKVPMTVASFVGLAEGDLSYDTVEVTEPYFNGVTFHRVIPNFMIQGGDPTGSGSGNPGYFFPDEIDTSLTHAGPGILSMANAGPNTNGSQFFITHKDTPWLDGKHAVFGHVVHGMDVVNEIKQGDIIEMVEILRIGKAAKKFKANKVFNQKVEELKAAELERKKKQNAEFKKEMAKTYPNAVQTESGLMYEIVKEGNGIHPESGKNVKVHYTGTFTNGAKFDSSLDRGKPFEFACGQGRVIKGWDEGIPLGTFGGEIRLIIPYWLAYGVNGRGQIPPKATLIFEIKILE